MNNQLIEKLILANQQIRPQFIYSNPALDIKITRDISKCLVNFIRKTRENDNRAIRMNILETIRNMCKSQPSGHVDIDDNKTELLIDIFQNHIQTSDVDIDKQLEGFLIRTTKEVSIKPQTKEPKEPEVVKALINLNKGKDFIHILSKNIIHWNVEDTKTHSILKELWEQQKTEAVIPQDLSIKVRSDIEKFLLENVLTLLEDNHCDIDGLTGNKDVLNLIESCSSSPNCFQICISILNSLLILVNFNLNVRKFIATFVYRVKNKFYNLSFSVLYPTNLTYVAALLDFDIDDIQHEHIKDKYIDTTLKYLTTVKNESEYNLIMLLSHFPQWFNIYFPKI